MRLIEAKTLKQVEVTDETVKRYAILSHRWREQEVNFKAFQDLRAASEMKGFAKIRMSCNQAVQDGLEYIWVDTCCIDKDSSAELSEAINSMYRWYQASSVCYAFLEDVHGELGDMESSVWFTRGWTLQELIAPQHVMFFDRQWRSLGTKKAISRDLSRWTGIDLAVLESRGSLSSCSIACRMSWASKRVTTRVEDTAYCLMGIFDVNMPLLYGEGEKAFLRLQMEIIKESDDHTIFAWPMNRDELSGLLARSPASFKDCSNIILRTTRAGRAPYAMTNRGLSTKFMAVAWVVDTYLVSLDCFYRFVQPHDGARLGIFLKRLGQDDQYARVRFDDESVLQMEASTWGSPKAYHSFDKESVIEINANVRQSFTTASSQDFLSSWNGFQIADEGLLRSSLIARTGSSGINGNDRIDPFEVVAHEWNAGNRFMSAKPGNPANVGYIATTRENHSLQLIMLGFDHNFNPKCLIATTSLDYPESGYLNLVGKEKVGMVNMSYRIWADTDVWNDLVYPRSLPYNTLDGFMYFTAIKGDRIDGVETQIEDEVLLVRIKRQTLGFTLRWTFEIFDPLLQI